MIKVDLRIAERRLGPLIEEAVSGQAVVIESTGGRMVRLIPVPEEETGDGSQYDRISRYLEELEQEHGPIDPQVMEEVREVFPLPKPDGHEPSS